MKATSYRKPYSRNFSELVLSSLLFAMGIPEQEVIDKRPRKKDNCRCPPFGWLFDSAVKGPTIDG